MELNKYKVQDIECQFIQILAIYLFYSLFSIFFLSTCYKSSVDKGDTSSECSHLPVLLISPLSSILPFFFDNVNNSVTNARDHQDQHTEGPLQPFSTTPCPKHATGTSLMKVLLKIYLYLFLFICFYFMFCFYFVSSFFCFFNTEDKENGDGNIAGEVWYSHPSRYPCSFCGLCSKVFIYCFSPASPPPSLSLSPSPLLSYPSLLIFFFSLSFK